MGDDAAPRGEASARQIFARGDKVGEAIGLFLALAVAVPAIALVLAAADMGDGIDEAAIHQAESVGGEGGRDGHAVGAIAIEQKRRRAVELRVLAVEQRDRDRLAVLGGRHNAARDIGGWIVTARNFLSLTKDPLTRAHVVVDHLGRRRHGGVGEAQGRRVVFVAGRETKRVSRLVEGNGVLVSVVEASHHDARQTVLALEPHQVIFVGDHIEDQPARPMRLDLAPGLASGILDRRLDDAVVLGAAGIGEDDEIVALMVHGIVVLLLARGDQARRRKRIVCVNQADLGSLMVVHAEEQETAALGGAQL